MTYVQYRKDPGTSTYAYVRYPQDFEILPVVPRFVFIIITMPVVKRLTFPIKILLISVILCIQYEDDTIDHRCDPHFFSL